MPYAPIVNGTYVVTLIAQGEVGSGVDYACQISEATIGATAGDTTSFDALCDGASYKAVKPTEWTLTLHYAQDFAAGGIALWLFENDGKPFNFEMSPYGVDAAVASPSFSGSGRVIAGPVGSGAKGEFAEGEVELPLDSKPTLNSTPPTLVAPTLAEPAAAAPPTSNGKTSSQPATAAA